MKIVIASQNQDKIREIKEIVKLNGVEFLALANFADFSEIVEEGETLEANAMHKAKTVMQRLQLPALADDSGLEVEALNRRPGVYSSRYAGEQCSYEDNCRKLLGELEGVPEEKRQARFRCVAAYVDLNDKVLVAEGVCPGRISLKPRGNGGFGYDPVFIPEGYNRTIAELSLEEKNSVSHRGQAFRKMKELLQELVG